MATMTKIERVETAIIRDEALKAMQATAAEYGLSISYKGGNFTGSNCLLKFEFAVKADDGAAVTREAESFTRLASWYGLKADDLGRQFTMRREVYKVVGLNTRSPKMPILIERVADGRKLKCDSETVQRALAALASR